MIKILIYIYSLLFAMIALYMSHRDIKSNSDILLCILIPLLITSIIGIYILQTPIALILFFISVFGLAAIIMAQGEH